MRGLGYRPDLPDARDHDALKVIRTAMVPASIARSPYTKVLDQGGLGSCTCNAAGQVIRAQEIKQLVSTAVANGVYFDTALADAQASTEFLSRLFAYYLARAVDHTTKDDAGTYIRTVFAVLNKFGFPPESAWTYSDGPTKFAQMPASAVFRRAADQRAGLPENVDLVNYSRIYQTGYDRVDAVKAALADGHLFAFGTSVSEHFCSDMSANGGRPIDPPVGLSIAGGHAMTIGGYDAAGADVLNSWSEEYGESGWCRFSWDYVAWPETGDLWIAQRAPLISQEAA